MQCDYLSIVEPEGFPGSSVGKESTCNVGDPSSIPGLGRWCWRRDRLPTPVFLGFPCGSAGKESTCNMGDLGSIPGLGRSSGEGKGYPLQHSGLENSMDSPWGRKELDRTKRLSVSLSISQYKLKSQRNNKTLKTFSSISSCLCSTTEGPAPERLL